jgi:hypothetical protein
MVGMAVEALAKVAAADESEDLHLGLDETYQIQSRRS